MTGSSTTSSTATGSPVQTLSVLGTYAVQADTTLATAAGVNVATVGTLTGTQLTELGIGTVRTTVSTSAEASALETLAAGGIKFDLVLGQTQTVANFMGFADAINATTLTTAGMQGTVSHAVVAVEGPDLTASGSAPYSYTLVGNAIDTSGLAGTTDTGNTGAAYATVELFQAATDRAASNPTMTSATGTTAAAASAMNSATAIAGVTVLPYSTVGTTDVTSVGSYTSALNVNLGAAPVGEPDSTVLSAADQAAVTIGQQYNLPGSLTAVVTQAGASSAGGLLDLLLDTRASAKGTVSTSSGGTTSTTTTTTAPVTMTFFSPLSTAAAGTATGTVTAPTAIGLYDAGGTLTAAGTALNNLDKILVTPTTFASTTGTTTTGTTTTGTSTGTSTSSTGTAATTLALDVGTYTAMTQVATNVAVFAASGGGDNIVWWDNVDSANGTVGHGAASLGFNQVESSVLVFDPTKGASAIGSFANISSLDVTNFGDGPLVVQISNVVGTSTGTVSAVGTYAGVSATATSTVTGGSGGGTTTMTGGSGGGTTTMTGGSGGGTTTVAGGFVSSAGASGNLTLSSTMSTAYSTTVTNPGTVLVYSQGTDTVQAGSGLDEVYASGPAATVTGGSGNLIFIAGTGNYTAGGGTGNDILYGNSGTAVLTGGGTGSSVLVAGTGNTTLQGGAGSKAVMFGGTAANSFTGSTGGSDTLVGGGGSNSFTMTTGDVAFGGANGGDTFDTGTGTALIVEGPGAERVNLGGGGATVFGGTGTDTYAFTKGTGGSASIIGFKAGDSLDLTGGFTAADATSAVGSATTGSFGTVLHLSDGTTINVFGTTVTASQISVT